MTWYWWKHWFWITGILLMVSFTLSSTSPTEPVNKENFNKKDKITRHPVNESLNYFISDSGSSVSPLLIRDHENQITGNQEKIKNNENQNTKTIHDGTIITNSNNNNNSTQIIANETLQQTFNETNVNIHFDDHHQINQTINKENINKSNSSDAISLINFTNNATSSTNTSRLVVESSTKTTTIIVNETNENENNNQKNLQSNYSQEVRLLPVTNNSNSNNENDSNVKLPLDDLIDSSTSDNFATDRIVKAHADITITTQHQNHTIDNEDIIVDSNNNETKNNNDDYHPHHHHKNVMLENMTKEEEIIRAEIQKQFEGEGGRKSKVLAEYRNELKHINFSSSLSSDTKSLLTRSASVSLDDGNVSSEALSVQKGYVLDAGTISGICLTTLGLCLAITLIGVTWYRRRYLNKPQTLNEPDSSGYIDDSTMRDNSDELYSLDNDSFLNSLEAMTIQNYWTDTVKHTKL